MVDSEDMMAAHRWILVLGFINPGAPWGRST